MFLHLSLSIPATSGSEFYVQMAFYIAIHSCIQANICILFYIQTWMESNFGYDVTAMIPIELKIIRHSEMSVSMTLWSLTRSKYWIL